MRNVKYSTCARFMNFTLSQKRTPKLVDYTSFYKHFNHQCVLKEKKHSNLFIMKLVSLYHLVGIGVVFLMALSFSLGFKETAIILGVGLIMVLVLGVFLILDNLREQLNYYEKRIAEISTDVDSVKESVEMFGKVYSNSVINSSVTLDDIRKGISNMEKAVKGLREAE